MRDGAGDFDFLFGKWHVSNSKLTTLFEDCDEWIEFEAEHEAHPILSGWGNVDTMKTDALGIPIEDRSMRLYDADAGLWSVYRMYNRSFVLRLAGGFRDGVGTFHGEEAFRGRLIKVRYIWDQITAVSARWEQSFSEDDGKTWKTNWIMQFRRTPPDHALSQIAAGSFSTSEAR